jgi:hypothetical protein
MPETCSSLSRLPPRVTVPDPLRLMILWLIVGIDLFLAPFKHIWMPGRDGVNALGDYLGSDFMNMWTAAKLVLAGQSQRIYALADFMQDVRSMVSPQAPAHIFSYPPNILPLVTSFGFLPYLPALLLWTAGGIACLGLAVRANPFCKIDRATLVLAALCPAALFNLLIGQNGAFTGALFLGGFYLSESAPIAAGVLFGLLTVKPHLGVLIPFALLLRRNWRCIAAAVATALALGGVSLLMLGPGAWQSYFAITSTLQLWVIFLADRLLGLIMPGPWADARMFLGLKPALLVYLLAAGFALWTSLSIVRREGITARSVFALAVATLVILPYGLAYDMPVVCGAMAVYLASVRKEMPPAVFRVTFDEILFGLLWAMPLAMFELKSIHLPAPSLVLLAVLARLHADGRAAHIEKAA